MHRRIIQQKEKKRKRKENKIYRYSVKKTLSPVSLAARRRKRKNIKDTKLKRKKGKNPPAIKFQDKYTVLKVEHKICLFII